MADGERIVQLEWQVHALTQRVSRLEAGVFPALAPGSAPPAWNPPPADFAAPSSWTGPPPAAAPERRSDPLASVTPSRVLAIVGGLVLLLGVGYLLRYAAAQGWLGPQVRVVLALAGSVSLAVVGLRLERGADTRVVGQVCTATASAGAYAAIVAAVVLYQLIPTTSGLIAAAMVAGAAVLHGARTGNVGIAGLGVGGALMSPVLVSADGAATLGLLFVALAAGLAVAVARRWPAITALAFVVAAPQLWVIGMNRAPVAVGVTFAAVFGVLILGACIQHARGNDWDGAWLPVVTATANSVSTAALGYLILNERVDVAGDWPGVWLIALGVVHAGFGLALSRRYFSPPIGVALALAGLLLADTAALVLTSGYAASIVLGVMVLAAAAALRPGWLRATARTLLASQLLAFAMHAVGFVILKPAGGSAEAVLLGTALCASAAGVAALIPATERLLGAVAAGTFLGLALLRLLSVEAPLRSLLEGSPDLGVALLLCMAAACAAVLLGQIVHRRFTIAAVVIVNYALSLAAVAFDPDGLGRVALTGLWASAGGVALVAGRRLALPDLRRGGAALLGAAVSKAALVDTTTLDGTHRALALLLCGSVLVATAVSEARASGSRNHITSSTP